METPIRVNVVFIPISFGEALRIFWQELKHGRWVWERKMPVHKIIHPGEPGYNEATHQISFIASQTAIKMFVAKERPTVVHDPRCK